MVVVFFLQATGVTVVDGKLHQKTINADTKRNRPKESSTVPVNDPLKTNIGKKPEDENEKPEREVQTPQNEVQREPEGDSLLSGDKNEELDSLHSGLSEVKMQN